ncbi:MAG: hypothetical protein JXA69_05935 [Phycisphaerae bacterium]|nr:hypothetical protein [Phycisphaerae bacterium]
MHVRSYLVSGLLIVAGCSQATLRSRPMDPHLVTAYEQLLSLFPEDTQGYGRERVFNTIEEQPMTYGLILSAESARVARTASPEAARRVHKAARWLIENQDSDHDGQPGWGLPQAWDAFQDGTTNPENQPYTITTALVMYGLLDSLQTNVWSSDEREEIRGLLVRVAMRWCDFWSAGYGGGFFWYSPSRDDAIFAVNSPSMFMGAIARLVREHPSAMTAEQRRLVQSRADDQARAAVATVKLSDGLPYWAYMALPNFRNSDRPNDLIHHVYTLWGLEVYRGSGGAVKLPWTRKQAARSLDRFWKDGRICAYPEPPAPSQADAAESTSATTRTSNSPAVLWSAGMLLAGYVQWGDDAGVMRSLEAIRRDYGSWPNLRLFPPERSDDTTFYPRYAAHVLIALAWQTFGPPG